MALATIWMSSGLITKKSINDRKNQFVEIYQPLSNTQTEGQADRY